MLIVFVKNDSNGIVFVVVLYNGYLLFFYESKFIVEIVRCLKKKGVGVIEKLEFLILEIDVFIE